MLNNILKSKSRVRNILVKWTAVVAILIILLTCLSFISLNNLNSNFTNTFIASSQSINNIEQGKDRTQESGLATLFKRDNQQETTTTTDNNNTNNQADNYDQIGKNGFYIRIDKIGLFKPAVKDVDPRYKDEYQKSWETGVSHGKFTAYPNEVGNSYYFAHSVNNSSLIEQYHAWFTRIDELVVNDDIIVYYEGVKYIYKVSNIFTVDPTATGIYTGVSPVPKVTLQTCGPPRGSADSRYIVEALRSGEQKL